MPSFTFRNKTLFKGIKYFFEKYVKVIWYYPILLDFFTFKYFVRASKFSLIICAGHFQMLIFRIFATSKPCWKFLIQT